jgi:hypothetical protein
MRQIPGLQTYLAQAVERLRAALGGDLIAVVLYGSQARGDAREASDLDLLVIAQGLPERWYERSIYLRGPLRDIRGSPPFSVLGKTPAEFEGHFPSLYLDIGLDGQILYDREGYAAGKLRRIREIINEAGLVRERSNGAMKWVWKTPPTRHWEITWEGFRELAG